MQNPTLPMLSTMETLKDLGFVYDSQSNPLGHAFNFHGYILSATHYFNLHGYAVGISAAIVTRREAIDLRFEMPAEVPSVEFCAAWLAYALDRQIGRKMFDTARDPNWLTLGRQYLDLLPWVAAAKAAAAESELYRARPYCLVERDWLRLAVRKLRAMLAAVGNDTVVTFEFDGRIFSASANELIFALPAVGEPWTCKYQTVTGDFPAARRRIMHDRVEIGVWRDKLNLEAFTVPCTQST